MSAAASAALRDAKGRTIRYVRLSLTDRCNFRCTYCAPETSTFAPRSELLTFAEIARLADVFEAFGVHKFRLTGGEPTVRADIPVLVAQLAKPGRELVMTTNGALLAALAAPLAKAGLTAINLSLDTLDASRFHVATKTGVLADVMRGLDAALAAGLRVKLNAVLGATGKAHATDEITGLCDFGWQRGLEVRFIEAMPLSGGATFADEQFVSAKAAREIIESAFGPMHPIAMSETAGPARRWQHARGRVGFISAVTDHFCDTCNRVRVTAQGELHGCLGQDGAVSLRDPLRAGAADDELRALIEATVWGAARGHDFEQFVTLGRGAPKKAMMMMGG